MLFGLRGALGCHRARVCVYVCVCARSREKTLIVEEVLMVRQLSGNEGEIVERWRERERNEPGAGNGGWEGGGSLLPAPECIVAPAGIRRSVRGLHTRSLGAAFVVNQHTGLLESIKVSAILIRLMCTGVAVNFRNIFILEKLMLPWTFGEQLLFFFSILQMKKGGPLQSGGRKMSTELPTESRRTKRNLD